MTETIRLRNVSVRYGGRVILEDVTLTLGERRIGVIGANGSGKSTFARLLNGLAVPTEGDVTVGGLDTRRHGSEIRRKVGFVFTNPDSQIVMPTVAEDVAFSLRRLPVPRSERARRTDAVLERFGLDGHADHPAQLLSGGQKQLLAFAAVLVTEPAVLVCDEPTTLLDLVNTSRIAALVAMVPQQVVLITHDLDLVADWARVVVFDNGRVVCDGPGKASVSAYEALMRSRV